MYVKASIEKLLQRKNLDSLTCQHALEEMLSAESNPLQTAAFLALLRAKKETSEELSGFITGLKQKMVTVSTKHTTLDIVGTGGDGAHTVNISTGSAILAASCGIKIAKHGNRAVSSMAGSADVLEALGIKIDLTPEKISAGIDEIGIGFCFAPHFHPALGELRLIRKSLNIPTTFNLLGPLLNPASPKHFLLGVMDKTLMEPMAKALQTLKVGHSFVVHGGGLDEMSCLGPTHALEIIESDIHEIIIDPQKLGFPLCNLTELVGSNPKTNAKILLNVFEKGQSSDYPAVANTLILNAGTAIYLYGSQPSLADGVNQARACLYQGAALKLLKKWMEFSHG